MGRSSAGAREKKKKECQSPSVTDLTKNICWGDNDAIDVETTWAMKFAQALSGHFFVRSQNSGRILYDCRRFYCQRKYQISSVITNGWFFCFF